MPKADATCECADLFNAAVPDRERCLIVCGAPVEGKNIKCRPCALGNHTGKPCARYVREPSWHFASNRTCAACGFDSALHEVTE